MVTTTRKKDSKKNVIKAKEEIPTIVSPTSKEFLEADHLRALEIVSRDVENSKLHMAVEEQSLANLELQLKILHSTIEKQRLVVSSRSQKYEATKQKYIAYKTSQKFLKY